MYVVPGAVKPAAFITAADCLGLAYMAVHDMPLLRDEA